MKGLLRKVFGLAVCLLKTVKPMTKEKIMKMIKKLKTAAYAAPLAVMAALPLSAQAALTDGVKNAITGGFSDAQEGAALIVVGFAALFGIRLIMRLFGR